eukprot:g18026.t1
MASGGAAAGSAPSSLYATPIAVGDMFLNAKELKTSFERCMANEGRAGRLDPRGSGGRTRAEEIAKDYRVLASYLDIIGRENGSVVECNFNAEGCFESAFLMLGGAVRMATSGVQQAYAMDSAFFKVLWNGQFGTLSFKDADNKIVLVAVRVQAKENGEMYQRLLKTAMEVPALRDILNNVNTMCFTDKHKGSESAMARVCRYPVYQAAKAPTKAMFEHHMKQVKELNEKAYDKLLATPLNTWANHAREKTVLGFSHDIVMQTARKLNDSAELKLGDPAAVFTPFAMKTYNTEFGLASELTVSPNGGGSYMYPQQNSYLSNRVTLAWGQGSMPDHTYYCTCKFSARFKIPCRHVLAVAKETNSAYRALELIDNGYRLDKYRAAANDPTRRIVPPVWPDLTENPAHRPPIWVEGQSGRPAHGPRKKARIPSTGETNTSSRTYAIYNATVRAAGGVGIPLRGGGAASSAAASASGAASTTVDLSQGASQGAS